jgi:hypothetical protein
MKVKFPILLHDEDAIYHPSRLIRRHIMPKHGVAPVTDTLTFCTFLIRVVEGDETCVHVGDFLRMFFCVRAATRGFRYHMSIKGNTPFVYLDMMWKDILTNPDYLMCMFNEEKVFCNPVTNPVLRVFSDHPQTRGRLFRFFFPHGLPKSTRHHRLTKLFRFNEELGRDVRYTQLEETILRFNNDIERSLQCLMDVSPKHPRIDVLLQQASQRMTVSYDCKRRREV